MKTRLMIIGVGLILSTFVEGRAESFRNSGLTSTKTEVSNRLVAENLNVVTEDLSEGVKAGLLLMREEEKLAHDLYTAFYDLYEMRIFSNISSSEATHMAAVLLLLNSAGLEDPIKAESGAFNNSELQNAYDKLLNSGKKSLVEALNGGAYVEELDILDLEEQLALTEDESVKSVYSNLLRASRNHLRAFNRVLDNNGVDYKPQLMSQDVFDEIVNGENECGANGNGHGKGHGRGCNK